MRVALFTETYLPHINGVVTHVKILKEGLEKLGHEVLVVCADANAKCHYIDKNNVMHCPAIVSKKLYGYGLSSPYSRARFKLVERFNPDILHIHNEFGIGLFGANCAKKMHKPLVYTLHTMYDEYIYYVAPRLLVRPVKSLSHKYFKHLGKHSTALTGPSQKVAEYFKMIGVKNNVSVVPNPVELDAFSPSVITEESKQAFRKKYHLEKDDMVACFCGRLGREKSVDILLDYFAQTVKPEDHIKLVVIGDGPCKPELEEQAHRLGIDDMVVFTGKVMHDEIPPYYASCDVYVTASLSDTNSISMLEGMATGLPVLQRYDELNKDQVVDGQNGYTFKDAQEFYQKLKLIQALPIGDLVALRERAMESVKRAGATNLATYILAIYENAIKTHDVDKRRRRLDHERI